MFSYIHIRTYVHICTHVIVGMEVVCDQCTQMTIVFLCTQANMHSTHWQPLTQWKRYKSNDDSCTGNVGESPL